MSAARISAETASGGFKVVTDSAASVHFSQNVNGYFE